MSLDDIVNAETERESADREEKIRARAHEIWEHEGRPAGRADLHWEQARREIEFESARSPATSSATTGTPRSRTRKRA